MRVIPTRDTRDLTTCYVETGDSFSKRCDEGWNFGICLRDNLKRGHLDHICRCVKDRVDVMIPDLGQRCRVYAISIEREEAIIYSHLDLSSPSQPHPATTACSPPKALYPGFPVATGKHAGFTLSDQLIGLASSNSAISSTYLPHL